MFSIVKKVVAGPKNTTCYEGQQLDLTYITDRVIAMAFPASDLIEKAYRNSIEDVASYLEETHQNNYLVINVSSRAYNYILFKNRVKDYKWPDHQAPPLSTLVQAAYDMYRHLISKPNKVVAVHCNHGKGRTGTCIISLFLLTGLHTSAQESLQFYNQKRFTESTYGVDQPCQLRYLQFIERIRKTPKIDEKLICFRVKGITQRGLSSPEDYHVSLTLTRSQETIYDKIRFNKHIKEGSKMMISDVFIELYCENWSGSKRVLRFNYNLFFLGGETKLKLKGSQVKVEGGHSKDFQISIHLEYHCLCHLPIYQGSNCRCRPLRNIEEKHWGQMIWQVQECQRIKSQDASKIILDKPNSIQNKSNRAERPVSEGGKASFKNSRQERLFNLFCNEKEKMIRAADEEEKHMRYEGSLVLERKEMVQSFSESNSPDRYGHRMEQ